MMRALFVVLMAANWPQFRGPAGSGISDEKGIPLEFGPGKNVVWKTDLPRGASSPVLAGDRIFLTGAEGRKRITFCLDRTSGKILWRREVLVDREERLHKLNDPASASAVTDGTNAYVFFGDFGMLSYGPDGNERWRVPLGPFTNLHGMAASPVIADGKVLQVCDQDLNAFVVAIDQKTGKQLWKTPRDEFSHSFSTPLVYRPKKGPAELIVPGSYQLAAYSIESGEKLWWVRGLTWQVKSVPVMNGDILYFNGWAPGGDAGQQVSFPPFAEALKVADADGDGKLSEKEIQKDFKPSGTFMAIDLGKDGLLDERDWNFYRSRRSATNNTIAIRLGGRGDVTDTNVLWKFSKSIPDVPSPLLYNGVLFLVRTGGIATTLNPADGKLLKQARLVGALDDYYASPVGADGKVYMISQLGKVSVLKAEGEWEVIGTNDMEEVVQATPAIADGRIYLRTISKLYCFAK